jgi:hypothetical protein
MCFKRYGDAFRDFGLRTAHFLFQLMKNRHSAIWEDSLVTLFLVITALRQGAAKLYTTERITQLIETALESESPSVISNVVFALGSFYRSIVSSQEQYAMSSATELLDRLPASFSLILQCFEDPRFTQDFYLRLLKALADIISAAARSITPQDHEKLFGVY